jgi:hypothetical protein
MVWLIKEAEAERKKTVKCVRRVIALFVAA